MDEEIFSKVFVSYIRPKLEYAYQVWLPYLNRQEEVIGKAQKRAAMMVPELRYKLQG